MVELISIRCYEKDKPFFIKNNDLEKYLTFKHKILIKKQEDLMEAIKLELNETLEEFEKNER